MHSYGVDKIRKIRNSHVYPQMHTKPHLETDHLWENSLISHKTIHQQLACLYSQAVCLRVRSGCVM